MDFSGNLEDGRHPRCLTMKTNSRLDQRLEDDSEHQEMFLGQKVRSLKIRLGPR